jgi:hypothetical protein
MINSQNNYYKIHILSCYISILSAIYLLPDCFIYGIIICVRICKRVSICAFIGAVKFTFPYPSSSTFFCVLRCVLVPLSSSPGSWCECRGASWQSVISWSLGPFFTTDIWCKLCSIYMYIQLGVYQLCPLPLPFCWFDLLV